MLQSYSAAVTSVDYFRSVMKNGSKVLECDLGLIGGHKFIIRMGLGGDCWLREVKGTGGSLENKPDLVLFRQNTKVSNFLERVNLGSAARAIILTPLPPFICRQFDHIAM